MARIEVTGRTVQVKSDVKLEDLKLLSDRNSSVLVLKEQGEDGKPTEKFRVKVEDCGSGSLAKFGAVFGNLVFGDGYALITMQIPESIDNVEDYVANKYGTALMNLIEFEHQVPAAIEAAAAERAVIDSLITVA